MIAPIEQLVNDEPSLMSGDTNSKTHYASFWRPFWDLDVQRQHPQMFRRAFVSPPTLSLPGSAWPVGSNDGDGNVIQQDWKNSGPSEDDGISRRRRRRFREGGRRGDISRNGENQHLRCAAGGDLI